VNTRFPPRRLVVVAVAAVPVPASVPAAPELGDASVPPTVSVPVPVPVSVVSVVALG
jgi:hypothetical protein